MANNFGKVNIKNLLKEILTAPTTLTLAIILVLSLLLKSLNLLIITGSLILLYKIFLSHIDRIIFASKLFVSVLILFSYFVLLQCAVVISWALNHNFPLSFTPLLLLAILLVMYLYNKPYIKNKVDLKQPVNDKKCKILNLQDVLALLVATLVLVIIVLPPLTQSKEYIKSTALMSMVNGNSDDSSHLALINDSIYFDRGIMFKSDAESKIRMDGFYPAGWPSINAIIIKTFCPAIETGIQSLIAYSIQKLFWFFLLTYTLVMVSFATFRFLGDKLIRGWQLFWASTASLFLSCTLIIPVFQYGFYSLLPQLLAVLLAIPIIFQLSKEKSKGPHRSIPFLLTVCLGGCLSWILPLPAFLLATLLIIISLVVKKNIGSTMKSVYVLVMDNLVLLLILITAIVTQLYVMIELNQNGTGVSFIKGILLDGGITIYDKYLYIFICTGFLAALLLSVKKAIKKIYLVLFLLAPMLLFCGYIYVIQILMIDKNAYYYYKMILISMFIAVPFCITGFGLVIKKIAGSKNVLLGVTLSIVLLVTSFLIIGIDKATLRYSNGDRYLSPGMNNIVLEELRSNITQDNYPNKLYSFFYIPDSGYIQQNTVMGMIAKSNEQNSDCFQHILWYTLPTIPTIDQLLDDIVQRCDGYTVTIVTDVAHQGAFAGVVNNRGLSDIVHIKSY